jgi:hypothetical protein
MRALQPLAFNCSIKRRLNFAPRAADGIYRQAGFFGYLAGDTLRLRGRLFVSDFRCSTLRHLNFTSHFQQLSIAPDMSVAISIRLSIAAGLR